MTTLTVETRWSRGGNSDPKSRAQRRYYAFKVLQALNESDYGIDGNSPLLQCPLSGDLFDPLEGHVDRALPALDYQPGNVILVSARGNLSRAKHQSAGRDMRRAVEYQADVLRASQDVEIPKQSVSKRWMDSTEQSVSTDIVDNGPYG